MDKCYLEKNDYDWYRTLGTGCIDSAKKYIFHCLNNCFHKWQCDTSIKWANIRFLEPNPWDAEKTD